MAEERRVERVIAGLGLTLVAIGCLVTLWPFATPLVWACTLVFATWPLFTRLERQLGGRTAAAAGLMTLVAAAVLVAPLVLLGMSLAESLSNLVALLRHWLEVGPPGPPSWVAELPLVGVRLQQRWAQIAADGASFTAALTPHLATLRAWVLSLGSDLGGGIARLLLSLVIAFFLYCHGPAVAARLHTGMRRIGGARGSGL